MIAPSHLKALQAVELAIRTGSLAAAAEILGITPAAVGQRVKTLEDFLGIELLHRGRFGIVASRDLEQALPHLRAGFAGIEAAATMLELQRGHDIYVAATSDFAELWLAPRLSDFRAKYPNVRFSINGEGDAPARIGKVDCEIVFAEPETGDQIDLLFHDYVVPICSPANAERTRSNGEQTRLEGFPLLHVDFYRDDPSKITWPNWIARHGLTRTAPERGMRFRRIAAALDAVHADAGVALCGIALLGRRLDDGSVTIPFRGLPGQQTSHAFIARYRTQGHKARSVQRFREWLCGQAEQNDPFSR
jgi:LysR family glycine cleavage system transcriptional activator